MCGCVQRWRGVRTEFRCPCAQHLAIYIVQLEVTAVETAAIGEETDVAEVYQSV